MPGGAMGTSSGRLLTPGAENRFRTAERRFVTDRAIVSAALPNPVSRDEEGEWIEITNVSDDSLALTDWKLDNAEGGSKPFLLKGILLASKETRRFSIQETRIQLRNSSDTVRLLDRTGIPLPSSAGQRQKKGASIGRMLFQRSA